MERSTWKRAKSMKRGMWKRAKSMKRGMLCLGDDWLMRVEVESAKSV